MENIHQETVNVRTYECGPDGTIYPHDLLRQMQEAASNHADRLGWGFADLEPRGLFWVLSVIRVEITHWPRFGTSIVLSTWPSGLNRLQAAREFLGTDRDGTLLFAASSSWMVLNRNSGRPHNLLQVNPPFPIPEKRALQGPLRRTKPKNHSTAGFSILVPASALDINGHVNNTEYLRWAFDALCRRQGRPNLTTFQITFHSEVFAGDELEFSVQYTGPAWEVWGFQKDGGQSVVSVFFEIPEHP